MQERQPHISNCSKRTRKIGRFVVHATLRTRLPFCFEDIASLVHACVVCSSRSAFYDNLIRNDMQLCVGWAAIDPKTHEVHARVSYVVAGANVRVLKTFEAWCCVKDIETGHTCMLPVTWLVSSYAFLRRERIPLTKEDVRRSDVAGGSSRMVRVLRGAASDISSSLMAASSATSGAHASKLPNCLP